MIAKNAGLSLLDVAAKVLGRPPDQGQSVTDSTTEAVTKFAAENPRFEELSDDIAFFLKSGRTKDLAEAYRLAERLNPVPASHSAS